MRQLLLYGMIALLFASCQKKKPVRMNEEISLPYYIEETWTPEWIDEGDERYSSIPMIADFEFTNQDGKVINNDTFTGKIYVTNFFFTICPSVCPKMTKNLDLIQERFLNDERVKILSHSVMPWVDSVATLKEYALRNEIDSKIWHLVTGDKRELYTMARESYFADEGFGKTVTSDEDFLHTENIMLVDQKRRLRGVYNGTLPLEMKRMIEDIETLLKE